MMGIGEWEGFERARSVGHVEAVWVQFEMSGVL